MGRPLVLIHGYSATADAMKPVRDALCKRGFDASSIDICSYISLNNEITIKDIAEGLDRAFRSHGVLKDANQEFDALVHSTGMLVLRSWLTSYGAAPGANPRLKRLKHLVGLAPATWGSPQAHKGRTWLGALVKGNREIGPDFLNAGDMVLDGLELGSALTWDLAHVDLLGPEPYYDKGGNTPYVAVFIGNRGYDGVAAFATDPGTDGTVRWAGCGLNTRKIRIDLTRTPIGDDGQPTKRTTITPWADDRLEIPMIAVEGKNHSSLIAEPEDEMMDLVAAFLRIGDEGGENQDAWLARAKQYGQKGQQHMLGAAAEKPGFADEVRGLFGHLAGKPNDELCEGWQQFVVHATDERGDPITDYLIEILTEKNGAWVPFPEMYTDVHPYGADASFRCFYVRLPVGLSSGQIPLRMRINASTGTELVAYQGYGEEVKQLSATAEPVELTITSLGQGNGTLFYPFTTTLIEIVLNREPAPLDQVSKIFQILENQPQA